MDELTLLLLFPFVWALGSTVIGTCCCGGGGGDVEHECVLANCSGASLPETLYATVLTTNCPTVVPVGTVITLRFGGPCSVCWMGSSLACSDEYIVFACHNEMGECDGGTPPVGYNYDWCVNSSAGCGVSFHPVKNGYTCVPPRFRFDSEQICLGPFCCNGNSEVFVTLEITS